jgi:hypothetical protein
VALFVLLFVAGPLADVGVLKAPDARHGDANRHAGVVYSTRGAPN